MADQPWLIMMEWIKQRTRHVASKHVWPSKITYDMYQWALAVENHPHRIDHFSEPPIPPVIGYVAQIAFSPVEVSDPVELGQVRSEILGNAADLLHGDPQKRNTSPDLKPRDFKPIELLQEWIFGRIEYAACEKDKKTPRLWSQDLTDWTKCIKARGEKDFHLQPPTPLVLGYIVQAACNYKVVADPSKDGGAFSCAYMGVSMAILDGRNRPWNEDCLGSTANESALALERNLRMVRVPTKG